MKKLINHFIYLNAHKGFFALLFVYAILLFGVIYTSGYRHLDKMGIVLASIVLIYLMLGKFVKTDRIQRLNFSFLNERKLNTILFLTCIIIFVFDMLILDGPPVLKTIGMKTVKEFTELRNGIHADSPTIMVYLSGFNIKGLLPFAIFHFLYKKNKTFSIVLILIASFYAFSMMQKSFIIAVLLPAIIYSIFTKKYLQLSALSATIVAVVLSLTFMLNNLIEEENIQEKGKVTTDLPLIVRVFVGLSERIFVTPGLTVKEWFEIVPKQKPYLMGDGYPFLAKLRGREYRDYSKELFEIVKPEFAKQGLKGTVNVASFVREYADFGYLGLFLGGAILSFLIFFVDRLFIGYPIQFLSLNLFPILLVSSSSILTILFSGGWALILLLFLVYKKQYKTI